MHAQPPGPGLPMQAPSVMSLTFFIQCSSGNACEFSLEESVYLIQNLRCLGSLINFRPKFRAVSNAVREVGGELFHLSDRVRHRALAQHAVVSAHDVVALAFRRMFVGAGLEVLLDLP